MPMISRPQRDHVVVIGDGRIARALAFQQARSGPVMRATAEPGHAAEANGVVEVALASDPASLLVATAAVDARLVFVDQPDDAATIATVAALLDGTPPDRRPAIVANIRDPALRRVVDDNLWAAAVSPRPRIVSTASLAAEAAIAAARPYDLAYWRGQDRVHAVVIGFSHLGRDCVEELIQSGIAGDLAKPRMTIIDRDPLAVEKLLDRDMPEIELSADIAVAGLDPLTLTAGGGPITAAEAAMPVTLIVVALSDPGQALDAMTSLARMQESEGQAIAAAILVTEGQHSLFNLARPAGRPRDLGRNWAVSGGIEADEDILDLLTRRADALSERIHTAYRARFGGFGAAGSAWESLPETYRRANRRAAAHLPLKLWTLGLRGPGGSEDPFAVDPHTYENVIRPCASSASEDALLRRLSRIEHDRWCAERRLDGWRYGEVRDDVRRIHPKLVLFDDPRFTAEDIEKDADQVRFLFGNVVTASPDGAVTPLVIGIVAGPHPSPGIGVAAALNLCRKEAWRPIVVVSALLDPVECGLLASLDHELGRDGRDWRLLVPEISRDNRELRVISEPDDVALLRAFLDRPTTRFASMGGVLAPADLWADPSAPDPHAEAIGAYITARASAIIDGGAAVPGAPPDAR